MVLNHVSHRPDLVVESASGPNAFLFGDSDLNIVDQVAVPDRLPD